MRMLAATTALISIAGFVSAAAQPPASGGGRPAAYAGCLVQSADGGFELAHAVPAVKHGSGGMSSAKASAPIGLAGAATDRPRTGGTTTPKGSTPVAVMPAVDQSTTTGGAISARASAPIGRAAWAPRYVLDARDVEAAPHAGRVVEVAGVLRGGILLVQALKPLGDSCAR